MLTLIFVLLGLCIGNLINDLVVRDYDLKGNIVVATYTISIITDEINEKEREYYFYEEFPKEKISAVSFTLDGTSISPKYSEKFC